MLASFFSVFIQALTLHPLESVRENLKSKNSFEVEFVQEVQQEVFDVQALKVLGVLKFERPNLIRWIYKEPKEERKEISFDGKVLRIKRESEEEIVQESGEFSLEDSFSFLWGESKKDLFKVENLSKDEFVLHPRKTDQAQFESIRVKVRQGLVQEVWLKDLLGGVSKFSFKNWRFESKSKN
jgi:outer membrane lipoprotein-sorting protein